MESISKSISYPNIKLNWSKLLIRVRREFKLENLFRLQNRTLKEQIILKQKFYPSSTTLGKVRDDFFNADAEVHLPKIIARLESRSSAIVDLRYFSQVGVHYRIALNFMK